MSDKHKKVIGFLSLLLFVSFMVLLFWLIGRPMIRFIEDPLQFRSWIGGKGIAAPICFIAMFFFQVVVAIIPGEPLEICAGYTFGALEGTILCIIGIALGSTVIFLLVRHFGVKLVEIFFPIEKIRSLGFLKEAQKRNTLIFLLMFIPGTPKDLLSYFAGLTEIKLHEWLFISAIARIPSIVTSTIGGDALAEGNYKFAAIVFIITAAISVAGLVIYNKIRAKHSNKKR